MWKNLFLAVRTLFNCDIVLATSEAVDLQWRVRQLLRNCCLVLQFQQSKTVLGAADDSCASFSAVVDLLEGSRLPVILSAVTGQSANSLVGHRLGTFPSLVSRQSLGSYRSVGFLNSARRCSLEWPPRLPFSIWDLGSY